MRQGYNVVALMKGAERYIYVYDDASRAAVLKAFEEQAEDAQLDFNWFDAAVLTQKVHEQAQANEEQQQEQAQPRF